METYFESKIHEYEKEIRCLEQQEQTAGKLHRRDLHKHINRMKKELAEFKRYAQESKKGVDIFINI